MNENQGQPGGRKIVVEIPSVDRRQLAYVWNKMKAGEELVGHEGYIGRSMADHPEWFPVFETIDVLGGDDTLPDGSNPVAHVTMHVVVASQIFSQAPPEAETFYRLRLRKGDDRHDVIHMMINAFHQQLFQAAKNAGPDGKASMNLEAYAATLKKLWPLKTKKLWQRLGLQTPPRRARVKT